MFIGVDRATKHVFFQRVGVRNKETLRAVLKKNIARGSTVMTDMWKGYQLQRLGFKAHFKVNHSKNFVNPKDRNVHTQGIESQWSKAKRDLRRRIGRMDPQQLDDYVVEWMIRARCPTYEQLWMEFTEAVGHFHL